MGIENGRHLVKTHGKGYHKENGGLAVPVLDFPASPKLFEVTADETTDIQFCYNCFY
jgi:hypothetical protein